MSSADGTRRADGANELCAPAQRAEAFKLPPAHSAAARRAAQRHGGAVSQPPLYAAKDLCRGDRGIVVRVRVAPGDQHTLVAPEAGLHHAVGEQAWARLKEDDVVRFHNRDVDRVDQQDVGRPDRREHARAGHPDAGVTASPQHMRHESRCHVLESAHGHGGIGLRDHVTSSCDSSCTG
jgi:hypothetical protein